MWEKLVQVMKIKMQEISKKEKKRKIIVQRF